MSRPPICVEPGELWMTRKGALLLVVSVSRDVGWGISEEPQARFLIMSAPSEGHSRTGHVLCEYAGREWWESMGRERIAGAP